MSPNVFVISDTHFYHDRIIHYCARKPIGSTEQFVDAFEMNEYMVEVWNSVVKPNDIVIHGGDFALCRNFYELETIFLKLHGKIHLVTGNHDHHNVEVRKRLNRLPFLSVSDHNIMWDNKYIISHKPVDVPLYPNLHGHTHDRETGNIMHINVCVDKTEYKPVSIDEIAAWIKKRGI